MVLIFSIRATNTIVGSVDVEKQSVHDMSGYYRRPRNEISSIPLETHNSGDIKRKKRTIYQPRRTTFRDFRGGAMSVFVAMK